MQTFYIIGISDNRNQFLSPEIRNLVSQGKVFSGGKRHHELVHAYLPEDAVWIDITVPLDAVFSRYEEHPRNNRFRFGRPVVFRLRQYRHEKTPVGKDYLILHLQLAANAGTPYIAPLSGDADLVADRTSLGCIRLCFNQRR